MLLRTVVYCGLVFGLLLSGCSVINGSGDVITDERIVDEFDSVQLNISGDLTIEQGERTFLTIRGEDNIVERIETFVRDETLVIRTKDRALMTILRNTKPIEITISTPTIEEIDVSGSGNVFAAELSSEAFDISISGSGDVTLERLESEQVEASISGSGNLNVAELAAETVDMSVSGSGDVSLAGRTNKADLQVGGSGSIDTDDLAANVAEVSVSGSGTVATWAKETLDVSVSGSGHVTYYGSPQVDQSVSGSGKVTNLGSKE